MTNPTASSEQAKRTRGSAKSAAARNLASAERLATHYKQILGVVCQYGMRLPQLETLLSRREARAQDTEALSDEPRSLAPSGDEDVASVDHGLDVGAARKESEHRWLRRELNLRARWRRVGAWQSSAPGWLGRRQALCERLAECRVRAIESAHVDRRVLDAFVDEVIDCCHEPGMAADEFGLVDGEARFAVTLPNLHRVGLQLEALRDCIRHERAQMVEHNRSLVAGIARRFAGQGMLVEDLIQEGTLGLLRAIDKFDPARGFQFSTYAIWWIRQGVSRAVLEQGRSVRVPVHLKEQTTRLRNVEARLAHRLGRAPTRAELGAEVGLSEAKVQHLQQQLLTDVSLQRPLYGDGDGELGDNLVDERATLPFTALDVEGLSEHLAAALSQLDPRSRYVVTAHLGLNGQPPLTLDGISQQLGISRERVRQIEREALLRLRKSAQETHLAEYV